MYIDLENSVLYFVISMCLVITMAIIILIGIIRANREKRHKTESDVDDPNERADTDIVYVRAGLNKQVKMTWGQFMSQWRHMDRNQRRIFMRNLIPDK